MKKYVLLLLVIYAAGIYFHEYYDNDRVLCIGVECDYTPNNWLENEPTDTNFAI